MILEPGRVCSMMMRLFGMLLILIFDFGTIFLLIFCFISVPFLDLCVGWGANLISLGCFYLCCVVCD